MIVNSYKKQLIDALPKKIIEKINEKRKAKKAEYEALYNRQAMRNIIVAQNAILSFFVFTLLQFAWHVLKPHSDKNPGGVWQNIFQSVISMVFWNIIAGYLLGIYFVKNNNPCFPQRSKFYREGEYSYEELLELAKLPQDQIANDYICPYSHRIMDVPICIHNTRNDVRCVYDHASMFQITNKSQPNRDTVVYEFDATLAKRIAVYVASALDVSVDFQDDLRPQYA